MSISEFPNSIFELYHSCWSHVLICRCSVENNVGLDFELQ